jgi:tRNA(Ile)-lysidine synthase
MAHHPGPGVAAVSGGADSVAMLRALADGGIAPTVAHVNHNLRGAASDADERFVRDLCADLGVPCRVLSADVAARAAGANLEATARRVRYAFFADVAHEAAATWIATAHTADDQAETVLHRLVRGTGLQGLRGVARNMWAVGGGQWAEEDSRKVLEQTAGARPAVCLLRPLLNVTRADVLAHLAAVDQPHREDASNADTRFTRNRIRHELLPLLRTFNPDVVSALGHLAEHAADAHEVVVAAANDLLTRAERPRAGGAVILDAAALLGAPRAVVRAALRLVWARENWPMGEMTFDAWERAVEVAGRAAGAWDFPGGVGMRHAGRVVRIGRRQ